MLSYWAKELQKINSFQVLSRSCVFEGQPIGILGLADVNEGVNLYLLTYAPVDREPVYMDFDKVQTHREEMRNQYKPNGHDYLFARQVYFGSHAVPVKSSQGNALGTGQMGSDWILSEALRQGWDYKFFEDYNLMDLCLTTMTLDAKFSEIEDLLKESPIRLERDESIKTYMVEAAFDLPVGGKLDELVTLYLADYTEHLEEVIVINGIEMRDMWKDFETIYEVHRTRGTFTEEELEAFILENERNFEQYCPRGMCFPVVSYEASPEISIQCFATAYLDKEVERNYSNSASSMGIMLKGSGELGLRGLPLKNDVIQHAMSPETQNLKFEVFYAHKRVPLTDVVFEV